VVEVEGNTTDDHRLEIGARETRRLRQDHHSWVLGYLFGDLLVYHLRFDLQVSLEVLVAELRVHRYAHSLQEFVCALSNLTSALDDCLIVDRVLINNSVALSLR